MCYGKEDTGQWKAASLQGLLMEEEPPTQRSRPQHQIFWCAVNQERNIFPNSYHQVLY